MKQLFILLCLAACYSCQAQSTNNNITNSQLPATDIIEAFNGEFGVYQNGLIYSPHTVKQLTHIVDSLNLKFKRCDLSQPFLSLRQGMAYYVHVDKSKAKQAAKDMAAGMPLQGIAAKYNDSSMPDSMLVVIAAYNDYKGSGFEFIGKTFTDYREPSIDKRDQQDYNSLPLANKWIADEPQDGIDLDAFYFTTEPMATPLREKYARMILYADCVIDTTTDIYNGAVNTDYFGRNNPAFEKGYNKTKLFAFKDYVAKNTGHIKERDLPKTYKDGWEYMGLDSMKKAYVRNVLSKQDEFKTKLQSAVAEYREGKIVSEDVLEYYVANYHSKKLALEMKRKRRVVGSCSMDQSPRQHAQQIAMLSAEAVNWETFLRAHLNIMNDRFDRVSDGSWSYAGRQTYIKELETLNLDVNDLLLGISLRTLNAADKHYYGNISRIGRAFAETAHKTTLVNTITTAIADEGLDMYNRILMFYLLNHYTYNLSEKTDRSASYQLLLQAKKALPSFVGNKIALEEKDYE